MHLKKRGLINVKKGQAAIFLVLASLILFGGVYFFFSQTELVKRELKVPPEFEPVALYVQECIKQSAEEGIETLGFRGGYIETPDSVKNNPRARLPLPSPPGAPAQPPSPEFMVPYWWHDGIDAMPTESGIRADLARFIEQKTLSCLDDFIPLEKQFDVVPKGEISAKVSLNDKDVSVDVSYDIEAKTKLNENIIRIKDFYYTSNIRLKKVYELAKKIMERENNGFFLEERTIDLMSLDPDGIPTTDIKFPCRSQEWEISNVRGRLKELLASNLPRVKVEGTDIDTSTYIPNPCTEPDFQQPDLRGNFLCDRNLGDPEPEDTYEDSYYNTHYRWTVDVNPDPAYSSMEAGINFVDGHYSFDVRPRSGDKLRVNSQRVAGIPVFFCSWHFTYDVSYPVMVTIYDKATENSRPYLFNFPFMVSVKSNQPQRLTASASAFEVPEQGNDDLICSELSDRETIIETREYGTGNGLPDADIEYSCGRFNCPMGKTDVQTGNRDSWLEKRFPLCHVGVVKASKEGYMDATQFIQTYNEDYGPYILYLNAIKDFGKCQDSSQCTAIEVQKTRFSYPMIGANRDSTRYLNEGTKDEFKLDSPSFVQLADGEKAFITVTMESAGMQQPLESTATYPPEEAYLRDITDPETGESIPEQTPISLLRDVERTYKVSVYLIDETTEKIKGAYEGTWTPRPQDIINRNNIVFHVIEFEPNPFGTDDQKENENSEFLSRVDYFSGKLDEALGQSRETPTLQ